MLGLVRSNLKRRITASVRVIWLHPSGLVFSSRPSDSWYPPTVNLSFWDMQHDDTPRNRSIFRYQFVMSFSSSDIVILHSCTCTCNTPIVLNLDLARSTSPMQQAIELEGKVSQQFYMVLSIILLEPSPEPEPEPIIESVVVFSCTSGLTAMT